MPVWHYRTAINLRGNPQLDTLIDRFFLKILGRESDLRRTGHTTRTATRSESKSPVYSFVN